MDEDDPTNERSCSYPNHEEKDVSLIIENQGRANQANFTSCFCLHSPKMFGSSWVSLTTSSQMPQTDSWSSPPTPLPDTQAPELKPSALISCDICWWVQVHPLTLWWSCPRLLACWLETSGLLHPRNGWKCRPLPYGIGAFYASGKSELVVVEGTVNQQCYIGILPKNLLPWTRAILQRNVLFVHDNATPQTARNTRIFLAGEGVEIMQWPAWALILTP